MFLVFEKQVVDMEDDESALDLFFKPNNRERMRRELIAYKKKMNISYKPRVFECKVETGTMYVYAYTKLQAKNELQKKMYKVESIRTCDLDELIHDRGTDKSLRTITEGKKVPLILGGY